MAVDHAEHLMGSLLILARNERGLTVREEVDQRRAPSSRDSCPGSVTRAVAATMTHILPGASPHPSPHRLSGYPQVPSEHES
jgi:hypothetical protein